MLMPLLKTEQRTSKINYDFANILKNNFQSCGQFLYFSQTAPKLPEQQKNNKTFSFSIFAFLAIDLTFTVQKTVDKCHEL